MQQNTKRGPPVNRSSFVYGTAVPRSRLQQYVRRTAVPAVASTGSLMVYDASLEGQHAHECIFSSNRSSSAVSTTAVLYYIVVRCAHIPTSTAVHKKYTPR